MINMLKNFWNEEEGQDLVEYALLLTLITLVAVIAITDVGKAVDKIFLDTKGKLGT